MKKIIMFAAMAMLSIAASAQAKFAIVDFNELVMLAPEADAARAQMAAASKEAQDALTSIQEEGQAKLAEYQQKSATWSPAIKESKEKELNDISNRMAEFQQSVQVELQQQQQELMAPIYQKAEETVQKLAKEGGYAIVFDTTQYVFADKSLVKDLTPDARKAMGIPEGRTLEDLQKELAAQQQAQ